MHAKHLETALVVALDTYSVLTFLRHADLETALVAALATDVTLARPNLTLGVLVTLVRFLPHQTPVKEALLQQGCYQLRFNIIY